MASQTRSVGNGLEKPAGGIGFVTPLAAISIPHRVSRSQWPGTERRLVAAAGMRTPNRQAQPTANEDDHPSHQARAAPAVDVARLQPTGQGLGAALDGHGLILLRWVCESQ